MLQPLDPPRPGDPVEVSSSLDTGRSSGPAGPTELIEEREIAQLASDQEENRRDEMALAAQQALYEDEEDKYYKGVEEVVQREMDAREAQAAKSWDDWALYDEMHRARPPKRRRSCLDIVVRQEAQGSRGQERHWRIPFAADKGGHIMLSFGHMEDGEGESVPSEASTVPVPRGPSGGLDEGEAGPDLGNRSLQMGAGRDPEGAIPLEFSEFQQLYDSWTHEAVTDAAVLDQFGAPTLEMLQAQRIVVHEGTQVIAAGPVEAVDRSVEQPMVIPGMAPASSSALSDGGGGTHSVPASL